MSIFIKKQRDAQKAKSRYLLTLKSSLIWAKLHQTNLFSKGMGLKIVYHTEYQRVKKISLTAMLRGGEFFLFHDLEGSDLSYPLHKAKIDVRVVR